MAAVNPKRSGFAKDAFEAALEASRPRVGSQPGVGTSKSAPKRAKGVVTLWSQETQALVTAKHWELPQVLRERAGGWVAVERPGLLPVTHWDGPQALMLRLVLLVDGYSDIPKRPVDKEVDALRGFGYRVDKLDRPPTLIVVGAVPYADGGVRESHKSTPPKWVVSDLGVEEILHTSAGTVARAKVTIELLEFAPSTIDVRRAAAGKAKGYTWQKGDTITAVARKELGSPDRHTLIRAANPRIKSWTKISAGTRITLPGVAK